MSIYPRIDRSLMSMPDPDLDTLRREAVNAARSYERVHRQRAETFRLFCEAKRDGRLVETVDLKCHFDKLRTSLRHASETLTHALLALFPPEEATMGTVVDGVLYLFSLDCKSFHRVKIADVLDLTAVDVTGA